jgi:light-regulated signal transduction histidine kinase (bacteriophytochrome)
MTEATSTTTHLDLSSCDMEPIRTPGSIQPHGFLLSLSSEFIVLQASANLSSVAGVNSADAIGQPMAAVLGEDGAAQIVAVMTDVEVGQRPVFLCRLAFGDGRRFDVLAHYYDSLLLLEFEALAAVHAPDLRQLYRKVGDFLLKLNDAATTEEMSRIAAQEIRAVTGFGRVMVYQFDQDGHGHVMAECRDQSYPSYLGQRFPASDIPRQARELYRLSRIRLIQDANYTPAPLLPAMNPVTGAPNDMSFAALRSVSPIHLQYMRNMGTLASMSVSLIVKGQLWGLISCHHATPFPVPFDSRTACEQLGQILAMCIASREDAGELQFRLEVRRVMVSMLAGLTQGTDFIDNMASVFPQLLAFARAGGAAILYDDRLLTYGDAPAEADIRDLVSWLDAHSHSDVFYTDKLSDHYPPAARLAANASGLLAMPISRIHKHYLLWFRPEVVHTIDWAGRKKSLARAASCRRAPALPPGARPSMPVAPPGIAARSKWRRNFAPRC